jgi:hypothetical protein
MKNKTHVSTSLRNLFIALVFGLSLLTTASSALAQTASESTPTTQKLRERIEKVVEEKRDQIKGVLEDLSIKRRGFVGEVQRVSAESITIKTNKTTQILPIDESVTLSKAGKKISLDNIEVGDYAVVIGQLKSDDFVAEHIVISGESLQPQPQVVFIGTLTKINKTQAVLEMRGSGDTKTLVIDKNTQFQSLSGDTVPATEFEVDLQCLVVGTETDKGMNAKVLRLLAEPTAP